MNTRSARITGPVAYTSASGLERHIPLGPCLIERLGDRAVDIIWGADGQRCAALPTTEVESAEQQGHLVLLD
jgi:hypothetical protein